jgi:hypothetical protein
MPNVNFEELESKDIVIEIKHEIKNNGYYMAYNDIIELGENKHIITNYEYSYYRKNDIINFIGINKDENKEYLIKIHTDVFCHNMIDILNYFKGIPHKIEMIRENIQLYSQLKINNDVYYFPHTTSSSDNADKIKKHLRVYVGDNVSYYYDIKDEILKIVKYTDSRIVYNIIAYMVYDTPSKMEDIYADFNMNDYRKKVAEQIKLGKTPNLYMFKRKCAIDNECAIISNDKHHMHYHHIANFYHPSHIVKVT